MVLSFEKITGMYADQWTVCKLFFFTFFVVNMSLFIIAQLIKLNKVPSNWKTRSEKTINACEKKNNNISQFKHKKQK